MAVRRLPTASRPTEPTSRPRDATALARLDAAVGPTSLAGEHVLAVSDGLEPLIGGLRRGTSVAVNGPAATSLALALGAGPSAAGSWIAVVGLTSVGLAAAEEHGICLERLAVITEATPEIVAALAEAFDVVVLGPQRRLRPRDARRLEARLRDRGSVLVRVGWPSNAWPERAELELTIDDATWEGVGAGHGHLHARSVQLTVAGRRGAQRPRRHRLWLPGPDGRIAPVAPPVETVVALRRTG